MRGSPRRVALVLVVVLAACGLLAIRSCTGENAARSQAIDQVTQSYASLGQAIDRRAATCIVDRAVKAGIDYPEISAPTKSNQDDIILNGIKQDCLTEAGAP